MAVTLRSWQVFVKLLFLKIIIPQKTTKKSMSKKSSRQKKNQSVKPQKTSQPKKTQTAKITQLIQNAEQYRNTGQWQNAEKLYNQILQIQPKNPQALQFYNALGSALTHQGQLTEAIACFQKVLVFNDTHAEIHNNLGIALAQNGHIEEATLCFQKALTLRQNYVEAYYNLGLVLDQQEQFVKAMNCYQKALAINPHYAEAYNNLGNIYRKLNQLKEAFACYQKALKIKPDYSQTYNNLGVISQQQGHRIEAITYFQKAISINPNFLEAHKNLGLVLNEQEQFEQAMTCFQTVLSLNPNDVEAYLSLGNAFKALGQMTQAMASYQKAISLNPNDFKAYHGLGLIWKNQARLDKAIEHYQKALAINPHYVSVHNCLVYALNFALGYNRANIFLEHQRFNEQHAKPLAKWIQPHRNDCNANRKLKIGYLSADFRRHSAAYFMKPFLEHHQHQDFEIFCYYNHARHDDFTQNLQSYADHWLNCVTLSDSELTEQIKQDQIDILVELSGHTDGNRLLVFARKAAPVQVFYTVNYVNTTGLTTIDYRITDNYADPQELADAYCSETLIRVPNSYYCYDPIDEHPPANELPALTNRYITFSSFNSYAKLNHDTFALWAQVLNKVPDSKLIMKTKSLTEPSIQKEVKEQLGRFGIEPQRILLGYESTPNTTIKAYHQIDIGLDTFPFNGATTTCQALWMGVPIVTLVGETTAARAGLSILSSIGLTELIAYTPEQYVDICIKLANDYEYLQNLRANLREKMRASPLMDGVSFTRYLESIYLNLWKKWCESSMQK
jgi:protein O-GlcNAc transferase